MKWLRIVAAILVAAGPLAGLVLWNVEELRDRLDRLEQADFDNRIRETAERFDRLELMVIAGSIGPDTGRGPDDCPEGWSDDAITWDSWNGGGRQFRICIRAAP
ncbi:MAG: hypothetical protein OXQ28_11085 [Acidobacteriota bacterium]|nr:hypothetical protein [Acidobacteriota bacterium]